MNQTLQDPTKRVPYISLLRSTHDTEYATIDKVLTVCAALSNLQPPLV